MSRPQPLVHSIDRHARRGVTLVELLVVITLVAVLMGAVVSGLGAVTNARVRGAASLIAGAVRTAFSRAASSSRTMRLVFDLDHDTIRLEQTYHAILVRRDDEVGDLSKGENRIAEEAKKDAERVIHLPGHGQPVFQPVKGIGVEGLGAPEGRSLGSGVDLKSVEVAHRSEPVTHGKAYLYFWPGGQTERASIQIGRKDNDDEDRMLSIVVSPLTGKVKILPGAVPMEKAREDTRREDHRL